VGEVPLRVKFPRLFDLVIDKWVTVQQMESRGRPLVEEASLGVGGGDGV